MNVLAFAGRFSKSTVQDLTEHRYHGLQPTIYERMLDSIARIELWFKTIQQTWIKFVRNESRFENNVLSISIFRTCSH